jgi:hypothetical protein
VSGDWGDRHFWHFRDLQRTGGFDYRPWLTVAFYAQQENLTMRARRFTKVKLPERFLEFVLIVYGS